MFICLEGIAGSGKTTQTKLLADHLQDIKTQEVFVSSIYEGAYRILIDDFMDRSGIASDQGAVMFLFQALHAVQYQQVNAALGAGKTVIADRWRYSFFAHHTIQNTFGDNSEIMAQLDHLAFKSLDPDITLLIDVPAEIAYQRYVTREQAFKGKGLHVMDREYFAAATEYYRKLAKENRWFSVDGTLDETVVAKMISDILDSAI